MSGAPGEVDAVAPPPAIARPSNDSNQTATANASVIALLNHSEHPQAIHWKILLVSWLGWLSAFATLMVFFSLSLLYRVELGLDDMAVAWIKSLAIGATGLGGLAFGIAGDRFGRRSAMATSLLLAVAGVAGAAAAPSGRFMAACAAIAGLGIGGQWASGQTLVGETVPARVRGRFGALAQSGAPLGLALATLAALIAPEIGWRSVFVITLAPAALIPAMWWLIPESDVWSALRLRVRAGQLDDRPKLIELWAPDVRRAFVVAFLLTLMAMANYWFTVSWLPEFMHRTWDLDLTRSGQWTLVFVTGSLLGYLFFAFTAEWIGRRPAFTLFCGFMAAGTAMLTIFEGAIRDHPALVLLFAFIAGVGTGLWSSFGPLYVEVFPTRVRTTAAGICMNVSRSFLLVAPLLVVYLGGQDLRSGIALAALFAVGAGLMIWFLPERSGRAIGVE